MCSRRNVKQSAELKDLRDQFNDMVAELVLAREMMLLNGLGRSAAALKEFVRRAAGAADSGTGTMDEVRNSRMAMVVEFTKEISVESGS